jgi:hypothetical protein
MARDAMHTARDGLLSSRLDNSTMPRQQTISRGQMAIGLSAFRATDLVFHVKGRDCWPEVTKTWPPPYV